MLVKSVLKFHYMQKFHQTTIRRIIPDGGCVSYLKLSSNHNPPRPDKSLHGVVSYPKSSSNHNLCRIKACLSLCYVMHLANRKWNEDVPFSANVLKKLQLYRFLLDFLLYLAPNIYDIGVLLICYCQYAHLACFWHEYFYTLYVCFGGFQ